ncbi:hypothetical protein GC176_01740 [bacterium]|nr:hypothetical protein [bacterium]
MGLTVLIFLPPVIALLYAVGEHFGFWDRLTGLNLAREGLIRIRSAEGYPTSWIYSDSQDEGCFKALESRISRRTKSQAIKNVLADGYRPSLITAAGTPIQIHGVPDIWPQELRWMYLNSHPVLYYFGMSRQDTDAAEGNVQKGKAEFVCTIGELESWLDEERNQRKFWVGTLAISLFSIALLALRLSLT